MFNLKKLNHCDILILVAVALIILHLCKEKYHLSPAEITLAKNPGQPGDFFKLPYKMECTPGEEKGSYYSLGLNPGGVCGAQKWTNEMMANNPITGGIGGSLLDN